MAWVKEFSGISNTSATNTLNITVPAGGVTAGHFLALGIAHRGTGAATWGVTDSRSNTWIVQLSKTVGATADAGVMVSCVVATTLQAGDTITLTSSTGTIDRIAASVQEFDDTVTVIDTSSTNDNGGATSSTPTSLGFTTTQNDELLIGVLNMVSAGRTYVADAPWTGGTKVVTTSGSGDRGVVVQWRKVSSTGTYSASGVFTVGGSALYSFLGAGFKSTATARSGKPKVWDGSAWVAHPAKVWNGSAWVAHNARSWDGTSWVISK